MIRLGKRFLIVASVLILVAGSSIALVPARAQNDSKIVYVAICVDSEMLGGVGQYIGSTNPHPAMNVCEYSKTKPMTVAAVFDSSFRNSHNDSFGDRFKLTWFAEMDYLISQGNFVWADNSSAGVSGYTATRDLLMNNWGTEIQTYGDSIEYHHHFMTYDGAWGGYDSGPDAGYPDYQMYALDHMIIDRNFYPSCWRSGMWIMPSALSSWLEQWIPFDYTPETGIWYPVHPSGMSRWQTRCPYAPDITSAVGSAFAYARDTGSAVFSICTHDQEDMKSQVDWLQYNLNVADADEATYPNVSFKYVSAREAMQRALGFTDFAAPTFTITSSNNNTYTIVSSEPLWGNHPYIALKYTDGTYVHVSATPTGTNTCTVTPPTQLISEENVARTHNSSVTASSYDDDHTPGLAIDGVESTSNYWGTDATVPQGQVPQWLMVDLQSPVNISKITTHFYDGDVRTYTYYIEASINNSSWTTIVPTKTGSGAVTDLFPEVEAQYVRITITANTANLAAHIEETKIYHVTSTQPPSLETMGVAGSDLYGNPGVTTQYTLTVDTVGSGSVVKVPDQASYASGTVVTLTAVPAADWSFNDWSGALTGSVNPANLTITGNMSVTATFAPIEYTLTVSASPVDGGSVSKNPDKTTYHLNDVILLTASPASGYSFDHWSSGLNDNPTSFTITGDIAVTAYFTLSEYTLTVSASPTEGGSVSKSPDLAHYHYNDVVQLTATANVGWTFDQWSGDLTGSTNTRTLTITGNMAVTAAFTQNAYILSTPVDGSGSISLNSPGPYHYGDVVQFTAVPAIGWSFDHWSQDLTGSSNPATLTITGNTVVMATFTHDMYTLTVSTVGSGAVNLNNSGPYYYGDVVELTAVPSIGWSLDHWSGDLSDSSNPATLVITGNLSVTAQFSVIHDVATTNVMSHKTIIDQGFTSNFTVTVENHGGSPETFNVTLYAIMTATSNTTMIAKTTVTLLNGASATLSFTWNTTGFIKGNYTITVYAWPVPGEIDEADNTYIGGQITVAMIGDVNGPTLGVPDGQVDIRDLAYIAKLYGVDYPNPRYNANCDLTGPMLGVADGKIDIRDLATVAKNYGKIDP